MGNKTLILGVGNILRKDDGIGPKVIEVLRQRPLANVDLMDGGIDGLALLDKITEYKKVILIDAVNMNTAVGTVKVFTPSDALINISSDALSTHGLGLAELIKLMQELEIKTQLQIIGVQPQDISFGEELTPEIASKIPEIVEKLSCMIL